MTLYLDRDEHEDDLVHLVIRDGLDMETVGSIREYKGQFIWTLMSGPSSLSRHLLSAWEAAERAYGGDR